jgi:hypothetical protein
MLCTLLQETHASKTQLPEQPHDMKKLDNKLSLRAKRSDSERFTFEDRHLIASLAKAADCYFISTRCGCSDSIAFSIAFWQQWYLGYKMTFSGHNT